MITLFVILSAHAGVVEGDLRDRDAVWAPRRVAVVVGVQEYADAALAGLRFPEKDARDLGAALGAADVGGFDRVFVIEGAEATTRAGIQRAIGVATADLQRDDTFLLYLSGHGTLTLDPAEGSRLWFLPSDGRLEQPASSGMAIADLEEMVADLPARRRVLIMDTCHNGRVSGSPLVGRAAWNTPTTQLMEGLRGDPPAPRGLREVSESEARLFAAQYHQPAMEDPALENGVYTHYLLAALTRDLDRADLDGDGLVDVTEAHDFARDRTIDHTGGMQVPRAEYRIVGREEIFLAGDRDSRRRAERALLSAVDEVLAKARLFIDGTPRGVLPDVIPVEPGRHQIEVQGEDGRTLLKRSMRFDAGDAVSVEAMFADHQPRMSLLIGGTGRHGAGWRSFHAFAGELEVMGLDPVSAPHWLRPELHLRASGMRGLVAEQDHGPVSAGDVAVGASLGGRWGGWSLGPLAEVMLPWRSFSNETGGPYHQAMLTGAVGGRALWTGQVGPVGLLVRADSRWVPYRLDGDWTSLWHQGLAVGIVTRR